MSMFRMPHLAQTLRTAVCLGWGLGWIGAVSAQGSADDAPFSLHGFGTIGLARSDSDAAEYVRDLSQPNGLTRDWSGKTDSVLGVQGNLHLGPQTEAVVQVISRYRYDGSHDPEVSWAFLSHYCSPDWQIRLGRLGTEFYMLSDSRLIGYSNTTVRPPPDFFVPLIFSYFDGVDVSAANNLGSVLLRGKLFAGRSPETSPFYGPVTWDLKGSRLYGGHLDVFAGPWQFRVGRAAVRFSGNEIPLNALLPAGSPDITALVPELSAAHTVSTFDSLGTVYDAGPLRVQAMLGRIRHDTKSYENNRAGFIVASYRIGDFTPYLGYSRTKSTPNTIDASPLLTPFITELLKIPRMDLHTVTLGTRWDFHDNMALKLQYDRVNGSPHSHMTFRGSNIAWDGRLNVLSVSLDFAF